MAISKLMGLLLCLPAAWASDLVFPSAVERTGEVAGVYRMNSRATGKGQLAIRWRDVYGRVIEDRKIPIELNDETEIGSTLDIHRGVAMKNTIEAHLNLDGVNKRGAGAYRPGSTAHASIGFGPDTPAATHVLHVEAIDPAGHSVAHYSGNLRAE
jgi:hypothetical protein